MSLADKYPFYLANEPHSPNADLEVKDKYTGEVATRVAADIELARSCGVTGTPAVFLNGKRVDPIGIIEIGFWDEMAKRFWMEVGETRPVSTLRRDQSATPDSRDPRVVP